MSNNLLALIRRPTIEFNPARAEHRYWYYQFRTTGSWGRCPYQWYCPADYSSVPGYIEYALSEWYMRVDGPAKKRPNYRDGLIIPLVDVKTARTRVHEMIEVASE